VKNKIKRFSEPKKEGYNILLNVLHVYFSFWLKKYFDMCFDHLIKIYASHDHYYSTSHMNDLNKMKQKIKQLEYAI
jgi:hypothetical protein